MELLAISVFGMFEIPMWVLWIVIAFVFVVVCGIVLALQWQKAADKQRKHEETEDWSADAKQRIDATCARIRYAILDSLRAEFGEMAPEEAEKLRSFIATSFADHEKAPHIPVETFAPYLQGDPYIFLQGSDIMGGVSVLPIRVSEGSEKCYFLEGLSVCYKRGTYRSSVKFDIRFTPGKTGQKIEEVLSFDFCKKSI